MPSLLDRVTATARKYVALQAKADDARDELREAVLAALDEGIPLSRVERASDLPRGVLRGLVRR